MKDQTQARGLPGSYLKKRQARARHAGTGYPGRYAYPEPDPIPPHVLALLQLTSGQDPRTEDESSFLATTTSVEEWARIERTTTRATR